MFRQHLASLPIFQDLNSEQLVSIEPLLKPVRFAPDEVIFEQGQKAEFLYILTAGEVVVRYKPYDAPPLVVSYIQPGGVFGWSAALERDAYSSGAVALLESQGYRIRGDEIHALCCQDPQTGALLLERLADVIAERFRATHTEILAILGKNMESNEDCGKDGFNE